MYTIGKKIKENATENCMNIYELEFSNHAFEQLSKMDKSVSRVIVSWLSQNIDHTKNPRKHGKGLSNDNLDLWRYCVSDYRILVQIEDEKKVVYAVTIIHVRDLYR